MIKGTEIRLASSHFPSGISWLNNFFLEIGVLAYNGDSGFRNMWQQTGTNTFKLKETEDRQKQWLPVLSKKSEFLFPEDMVISWSHDLPYKVDKGQKVILFVRDGRDAVYSTYRRDGLYDSLDAMLSAKCIPLWLTPPETWAIFYSLWLKAVPQSDICLVRFEDLKTRPLETVKSVMRFIGIERPDYEVEAAIDASSFENAKKAEAKYKKEEQSTPVPTINRSGSPMEWKNRYDKTALSRFKGFPEKMLVYFGYERLQDSVDMPPYESGRILPSYSAEEQNRFDAAWRRYLQSHSISAKGKRLVARNLRILRSSLKKIVAKATSTRLISSMMKTKEPYTRIAYGMNGEDILLGNLTLKKSSGTDDKIAGLYASIGPKHPSRYSLTYVLYENGWRGVNILAADAYKDFVAQRPRDRNLLLPHRKDDLSGTDSGVGGMLKQNLPKGRRLNALTVDDPAWNYEMIKTDIWGMRPRIVVVKDSDYSHENPESSEVFSFMRKNGYALVSSINNLLFFSNQAN